MTTQQKQKRAGKYGHNISRTRHGTFLITKTIKGKRNKYGTFKTQEDALFVRSLLEANDWDMDAFDSENPIYENDSKFYIIKHNENGKLKIYGIFDSLEEAKANISNDTNDKILKKKKPKAKKPHEEKSNASKYGKYIYKNRVGKFMVQKNLDGVQNIFGFFDAPDIARFVRDILIENDWNVDYFSSHNIFEFNDEFYVFKVVRGYPKLMDVFSNLGDAELANFDDKDILERREKHIYKKNNVFVVNKHLDGANFHAKFDNLDDAVALRDILNDVEWDMDYLEGLNNIIELNNHFWVFFMNDSLMLYVLESFDSLDDALKNRDSLIEEFEHEIVKKPKHDKNIYKRRNGFSVVKRIDGVLTTFGTFDTREEAIEARDELMANNWNRDEKEETLNPEELNEIIFCLTPWQKIVFDAINELNSNTFRFEDLKQFEKNFKRFTAPSKVDSKVLQNLDQLIDLGLLVRTDENTYQKLWNY
ncbi:MAG: hypothetical protein Q4P18_03155 [Methanobrevibacter sp.]|uniref:hypothetical protein n=1 Tax=Methanobrevibacter sp. TaxID=66852 RepID=UPI0026E09A6E|nr:hypothetical protein [Methanobrevibacter sp.]MDO5848510.1 hypothetical protein [Methanobrevibacter sp.]